MNRLLAALLIAFAMAGNNFALAQDAKLTTPAGDAAPTMSKQELDQLLAPIALYPDDLLSSVLMASTYPLDVVQAARWRGQGANAKLKGDALAKALEAQDWDPSVKALVQFPDVLKTMSDKLDWTQKLGEAFLAQQDEVMDAIQVLREKADQAGNLKSNKQQKVSKEGSAIVIAPANPEVVYVPVYQPSVVYGPWWYPDYPPYYWPPYSGAFVSGFFWGAGIVVANSLWGWGHCDWRGRNIDIDVNKWNHINVNRGKISSNKWAFDPAHRGPVPYKNKGAREKYGQADRKKTANKDFRGFDKGSADRSQIEARLKDTDHGAIKDRRADGAGADRKDKGAKLPSSRDLPNAGDRKRSGTPDRAAAKRPSPAAFDVKRGSDVRRSADRGHASRVAMSSPRGRGGGGGGGAAAADGSSSSSRCGGWYATLRTGEAQDWPMVADDPRSAAGCGRRKRDHGGGRIAAGNL